MAIDAVVFRTAQFRGTNFLYQTSSVTGGRKTVTHEYPDSPTREIEDLGLLLNTFNIEAIIDTNTSYASRDAFVEKLEKPGIGVLVHPRLGRKNVVVKSYTENDNLISERGVVKFSIVFEEAARPEFPLDFVGTISKVNQLKGAILQAQQAVGAALFAINKVKAAYGAAVSKVNAISDNLKALTSGIVGSADTLANLSTAIVQLRTNLTALLQSPETLFLRISNAVDLMRTAPTGDRDAFEIMSKLFDFDAGDGVAIGTSPNIVQRQTNQDLLNGIVRIGALAEAYDAAVNIEFDSFNDLNDIKDRLEDAFNGIIGTAESSVADLLHELRIEANKNLDNLSLNLASVATINTKPISLNVLAYQLYGSLDNKEALRKLNTSVDTSRLKGAINILTRG